MKPPPNDYHVMRSMDLGEQIYHPWLPKRLAEKLAAVLQEIEDDRRSRAKDKRLCVARSHAGVDRNREDKAAFDSYYVARERKRGAE